MPQMFPLPFIYLSFLLLSIVLVLLIRLSSQSVWNLPPLCLVSWPAKDYLFILTW